MANEEHLALLRRQNTVAWNHWRDRHPEIQQPDISNARLENWGLPPETVVGIDPSNSFCFRANLREVNFSGAYLCGAQLAEADLRGANLSGVNLSEVRLYGADLRGANLSGAILTKAQLGNANLCGATLIRASLWEADLTEANLSIADLTEAKLMRANFSKANLSGANLDHAVLSKADLTDTNLQGAFLEFAKLIRAQLVGADLRGAKLTGACLESWNTDSTTQLEGVDCKYVYWQHDQQERCPSVGNFAPGDFTKRYQKYRDTFDWVFHHGVNWVALAYSFKFEWEREGIDIKIKGIEEIDDGVIRIRVKVPPEVDKGKVEKCLKQDYHKLLAIIYKQQGELKGKDEQIQLSKNLLELFISHPRNQTTNHYRQVEIMSDKRSDIKIGDVSGSIGAFAGGDISGVAGQNMTGVAGGDISGTVTNTISQLKESDEPEAPKLADLLKQLQTAIQQDDSGLNQKDKEKALKHLNAIGKLGSDRNNSDLKEMAENALDALPTILKRGTGLLKFVETHFKTQLDTILENIGGILNL